MRRTSLPVARQRGAALLLMMLAVLISVSAVMATRLNLTELRTRKQVDAQAALTQARDALIDYAIARVDLAAGVPATLPCPDIDGFGAYAEGEAHMADCGPMGQTVMGRLPWRTLGIAPLKDSSQACLWYVVSGSVKDAAGGSRAELVNPDSHGQLQIIDFDTGTLVAGASPESRPLAAIIAPMSPMATQARPSPASSADQCSRSFAAAEFLDAAPALGLTNQSLAGASDVIDALVVASGVNAVHNDRVALISVSDIGSRITARHDYPDRMRSLGLAIAGCVADYARRNSGGANDRRMPWPAPVDLADYRPDSAYDDTGAGMVSGRLPDIVDDSSAATGNPVGRLLGDCDPVTVPAWTPAAQALWQNWKDHFFYAVAESFSPVAAVPSSCTVCQSVNGAGQFAAVVVFAGTALGSVPQSRHAPPLDSDTRDNPANYLEGINAANFPVTGGALDFDSQPESAAFNDLLFCVDDTLTVSEC